jgi:hypothetical protein
MLTFSLMGIIVINNIKKFILIHEADNVLVCCQAAETGESVELDGEYVELTTNIDIGHKIARQSLLRNQKIIRYGVSIGSATSDIAKGSHVHIHNMKSDYIPSHTRQSLVGE